MQFTLKVEAIIILFHGYLKSKKRKAAEVIFSPLYIVLKKVPRLKNHQKFYFLLLL